MSQLSETLRADLAARNAERETSYTMVLTEDQVIDLASDFVPMLVRAMARTLLDWADDDRRKAEARTAADTERARRRRR